MSQGFFTIGEYELYSRLFSGLRMSVVAEFCSIQ